MGETGTDVAEGNVVPICRQNWRGERSRGYSQRDTGVGGANDVVSGAARGDGVTGMLEGTTNGD